MALEDYMEPEIAVTAVVTAAIFSPRARQIIRRGAVYGMAGVLMAGDALSAFTRSVGEGFQQAKAAKGQQGQQESSDMGIQSSSSDSPRGTGTSFGGTDGQNNF